MRALVESSPIGMAHIDQAGRCQLANAALASLLEVSLDTIVGKTIAELGLSTPACELLSSRVVAVLESGTALELTLQVRDARRLKVVLVPSDSSGAGVAGVLAYARIDESGPRLDASRQALAIRLARIGIWDWEIESDRTQWNEEMFRLYGVTREQFTGRGSDYAALTREDFREVQRAKISRAFESGVTEAELLAGGGSFDPMEFCIVGADGVERWARADAIAIVDEERRPVRMLGVTMDITAQLKAERLRDELEERFVKAFRLSPAPMVITSLDGIVIDANHRFAELLEYAVEEIREKNVRDLGFWPDLTMRERIVRELVERGQVQDIPAQQLTKTGQVRDIALSAVLITIGGQRCLLTFCMDLTAFNRLQRQFLEAQRLEAIGRLAGGVAHDFNNLLTVINGCADACLGMPELEATLREELESIRGAGQRCAELTRQLLAFGRKQILSPQVIDLRRLVRELEPLLRPILGEDISLVTRFAEGSASVRADRVQLEQVLMNLIVNACDAMPQGGKLVVEVADRLPADAAAPPKCPPGACVFLAVADTGHGMSDAIRSQIFEPFFTTKAPGKGTGLGLATVHGIVEQSGGTVSVESELGKGSRFLIALPCSPDAEAPANAGQAGLGAPNHATILLVEDDDDVRKATRRMLTGIGFRVVEADGGKAALAAFKALSKVDLLLTDVVMPHMNGRELAESLLAEDAGLRVLFMSGHAEDAIVERGILAPGIEFIGKPFSRQELAERISQVLARPAAAATDGVKYE